MLRIHTWDLKTNQLWSSKHLIPYTEEKKLKKLNENIVNHDLKEKPHLKT